MRQVTGLDDLLVKMWGKFTEMGFLKFQDGNGPFLPSAFWAELKYGATGRHSVKTVIADSRLNVQFLRKLGLRAVI